MAKGKNQRRNKSYNPNLGFIGQVKVDVSNYIFSSRRKNSAYAHTRPLVKALLARDVNDVHFDSQKLTKFIRKRDLTFQKTTKNGSYKIFTVPCTTTVVPLQKSVFNRIEKAAQALVVSLRAVIQDIYGAKSIEESGFVKSLPKEVRQTFIDAVKSSPSYFLQLHHPNMKKYPFFDNVGLDLVLVEDYLEQASSFDKLIKAGKLDELPLPFRILELNAGAPSGASNNMNVLEGLYEQDPTQLKSLGKMMPNDHFSVLADTYKSLGEDWTGIKEGGVQVILPPGGGNGAAPEIHNLAAYSGLVYADPVQLFCDDKGFIRLRTINGSNPIVTAIYSRINADSALFDPEKGIMLRDADSGEPIYLRDSLKLDADGKASIVTDVDGKPIPLQSDYAIPGAMDAIINRRMYMGGLNRILDNKIILASLTTYAPKYFEKRLKELNLTPADAKIAPPDTLASKAESVEIIANDPDEWVIKAPNLSGGTGVYILKTLPADRKAEVIEMARKEPTHFAYQRLVKIARIPVAMSGKDGARYANLAADIRLWVFFGGGAKALPKMTHNALVRYAPQERGPMSSIVNTSKGGGYAPFVVVDDIGLSDSVEAKDLVRSRYPVPLMTHLPMFVAAQLIQVSRLALEMRRQFLSGQADSYELNGMALALKHQCREILSFLNPRAIEPIYKLIDMLETKQAKKEISHYHQLVNSNSIKLVSVLQRLEAAGKLPKGFRDELDKLNILNSDLVTQHYTEDHRKADKRIMKTLREMIGEGKDDKVARDKKRVLALIASSINAAFPRENLGGKAGQNMAKLIEVFMLTVRERLQNSEKAIEFAKLFSLDVVHPELTFETYGLNGLTDKKGRTFTASQREFNTGELLVESDLIAPELKAARSAWLQVLEQAKKLKKTEKESFIAQKRTAHFKQFPQLARFQELIGTTNVTVDELIELMPVMPYAKFNLEQFAAKQGLALRDVFASELTPNRISLLSSKGIRESGLSAQEHAGECFAKKRKSHGLFSDSDIFLWVRKELDPLTQIYTAGHEVIHFHQIEETTSMEANALSDGAIAQAYFLNFYGNFLGVSNRSLDSLSVDVSVERQPLYGLTDRIVPHFFAPVIAEVRRAIATGTNENYAAVLQKYGSLFGYMMPNSTQVRVKALQEVLPALENAKNIRFAKELGLDIAWDEIKSALPSANESQVKLHALKIERAIRSATPDYQALIAIGNHQYYGVSFGYKVPAKDTLVLRPLLSMVSLGNSYNQTQQQQ